MKKIRIAICGYGNLGKGVEKEIQKNPDMELVGIFSRRPAEELNTKSRLLSMENIEQYIEDIDVVIMCGGSANDLEFQVPQFAEYFNTVDSYDMHAKIPEYYAKVNQAALRHRHISIISIGWDPGLFSLIRHYGESFLPEGKNYTFWGKGISQGHSNAIRRIKGVKDAVQYTIPVKESVDKVRRGEKPELTTRDKHIRECYVVLYDDADAEKVQNEIVTMPNYFAEYETIVHFITEEELKEKHCKMQHGGAVICGAETGENNKQLMEFSLTLESNPEFTASVMIAYARAAYRMKYGPDRYVAGAKTIYDVPPILLSPKMREELIKSIL